MKKIEMLKLLVPVIFFTSLLAFKVNSQVSPKDSIVSGILLDFHYSFQVPFADIAERFGVSSTIGAGIMYKTKNNFLLGGDFNYIFGTNVKEEDDILSMISTSDGQIIDGNGMYAEVICYERGFYSTIKAGKIFPLFGPNDNSGLFVTIGSGLLQHWIRIINNENTAPQLAKEYRAGYDRLSNGICFTQSVGYFNIGNKKAYSFTAGFEFIQAFTENRRGYNYDLMGQEENTNRIDLLLGIKISWMLPLFRQPSDGYYY